MPVLGVFFTRGVGIGLWYKTGLLDRELLIYREYLRRNTFERVKFFTYGVSDIQVTQQLINRGLFPKHGIDIVAAPAWIRIFGRAGSAVYSALLPLLHCNELSKCDVYKTNQMEGALTAVLAAVLYRKPLYVRTGYTLSLAISKLPRPNFLRKWIAYATEWIAFKLSDRASVSSQYDLNYVIKTYDLHARPPILLGNYVDVQLFNIDPASKRHPHRFLFVGRLSPQKNLGNAITACTALNVGLDIVGEGVEKNNLEDIASQCNADVRWLGKVPNRELPQLLNQYRYFLLPSLWEGMPKALIEALAAGLICVGTDVTGIRELLEDGVTGFLAEDTSSPAIEHAMASALNCDAEKIGEAARRLICLNFSLEAVVEAETKIFTDLLADYDQKQ